MNKKDLEEQNSSLINQYLQLSVAISDLKKQTSRLESRAENMLDDLKAIGDELQRLNKEEA